MELIDRQEALEIAMSYCPDDDGCCSKAGYDIREMLDEIEALPTIEPEVLMIKSDAIRSLTDEETAIFEEWLNHDAAIEPEVRHSVLIRTGNDFVCGKCATTHRGCREDIRYCMRCGCKFDLGVKTYPDDYCKDDDGSGVGQTFSAD